MGNKLTSPSSLEGLEQILNSTTHHHHHSQQPSKYKTFLELIEPILDKIHPTDELSVLKTNSIFANPTIQENLFEKIFKALDQSFYKSEGSSSIGTTTYSSSSAFPSSLQLWQGDLFSESVVLNSFQKSSRERSVEAEFKDKPFKQLNYYSLLPDHLVFAQFHKVHIEFFQEVINQMSIDVEIIAHLYVVDVNQNVVIQKAEDCMISMKKFPGTINRFIQVKERSVTPTERQLLFSKPVAVDFERGIVAPQTSPAATFKDSFYEKVMKSYHLHSYEVLEWFLNHCFLSCEVRASLYDRTKSTEFTIDYEFPLEFYVKWCLPMVVFRSNVANAGTSTTKTRESALFFYFSELYKSKINLANLYTLDEIRIQTSGTECVAGKPVVHIVAIGHHHKHKKEKIKVIIIHNQLQVTITNASKELPLIEHVKRLAVVDGNTIRLDEKVLPFLSDVTGTSTLSIASMNAEDLIVEAPKTPSTPKYFPFYTSKFQCQYQFSFVTDAQNQFVHFLTKVSIFKDSFASYPGLQLTGAYFQFPTLGAFHLNWSFSELLKASALSCTISKSELSQISLLDLVIREFTVAPSSLNSSLREALRHQQVLKVDIQITNATYLLWTYTIIIHFQQRGSHETGSVILSFVSDRTSFANLGCYDVESEITLVHSSKQVTDKCTISPHGGVSKQGLWNLQTKQTLVDVHLVVV